MKMMQSSVYLCIIICVQILVHGAVLNDDEYNLQKWNSFKVQHTKQYETIEEEERRMKIYLDNEKKIAEHNERFENGEETYELGINEFSDLTTQEFNELYLTKIDTNRNTSEDFYILDSSMDDAPAGRNWVQEGKVTRIKNQGSCGSCWAFTSAAAIESHVAIRNSRLVDLSPQNLVDCVRECHGCNGGHQKYAFDYIRRNRGIAKEASYPYRGQQGYCRYNSYFRGATIQGYRSVEANENVIKQVVGTIGPVAATLDARMLHQYRSGVLQRSECQNQRGTATHAIVIVGYGRQSGMDYWLVKNSWGTSWGMNGYFLIARNVNMCGIANDIDFPIGVTGI
ncbi:cathepsin L-like proteinase [Planococcus citri]|uniref:cathepsin L-like proteinase n=1 Tax=Planococcus citri TaxID=170843 RepID=UPI0031F84BC7